MLTIAGGIILAVVILSAVRCVWMAFLWHMQGDEPSATVTYTVAALCLGFLAFLLA